MVNLAEEALQRHKSRFTSDMNMDKDDIQEIISWGQVYIDGECRTLYYRSEGLHRAALLRFQVTYWACCPIEDLLSVSQVDTLVMSKLTCEPVQNLMKSITRLRRLWEKHGLLHLPKQPLLPQYDFNGY
ncbi:hypothetical protein AKJ16_DCAP05049 [Drosera capensis]